MRDDLLAVAAQNVDAEDGLKTLEAPHSGLENTAALGTHVVVPMAAAIELRQNWYHTSYRKMLSVSHPLALALYSDASMAAEAAAALHVLGISREQISVVAHSHADARTLADRMDATPGADLEDSRPAGRLGELSGQVLAAIALVMPGIGPIVAAGPLATELGEAAGHLAGSLASVLKSAGLPREPAETLQREVARGAVLLGVHVAPSDVDRVRDRLSAAGATQLEMVTWG